MVKLINSAGRELLLGEVHAERLLQMPRNGGWTLPEDSDYRLTKDGLRKNKAKPTRKKKEQDDRKSPASRGPNKVSRGEQSNG